MQRRGGQRSQKEFAKHVAGVSWGGAYREAAGPPNGTPVFPAANLCFQRQTARDSDGSETYKTFFKTFMKQRKNVSDLG